jgi:hypothetical protein
MNIAVSDLTGQDLAYWVARANQNGSAQERNVIRWHYGDDRKHELMDEPSMRVFIVSKLGNELPPRDTWQ